MSIRYLLDFYFAKDGFVRSKAELPLSGSTYMQANVENDCNSADSMNTMKYQGRPSCQISRRLTCNLEMRFNNIMTKGVVVRKGSFSGVEYVAFLEKKIKNELQHSLTPSSS